MINTGCKVAERGQLNTVFSPRMIQGMVGGRGMGVACGHIKAFGLFLFPHQTKICSEGLQGRHALSMLGRTLQYAGKEITKAGSKDGQLATQ